MQLKRAQLHLTLIMIIAEKNVRVDILARSLPSRECTAQSLTHASRQSLQGTQGRSRKRVMERKKRLNKSVTPQTLDVIKKVQYSYQRIHEMDGQLTIITRYRLSLVFQQSIRRLACDESNKLRHTLLNARLGFFGHFGRLWKHLLHDTTERGREREREKEWDGR